LAGSIACVFFSQRYIFSPTFALFKSVVYA
jgi:hypothetical protein